MKPCPTCGGSPAAHAYGANWLIRCCGCNATNGIVHNDEDLAEQAWDDWADRIATQRDNEESVESWRKEAQRLKNENRLLGEALLNALQTAQHGQAPHKPLAGSLPAVEGSDLPASG